MAPTVKYETVDLQRHERLLGSAIRARSPALVAVGFLAALVAWSPSDHLATWATLLIELAVVAVLAFGRPAGSQRFALPIALLVVGLAVEVFRASNQNEALGLFRSFLAVILLYWLAVLARGRWVSKLLFAGLFVGCTIATASIVYLWSGDPRSKVSFLNHELHTDLGQWLAPTLSTRVEPANLNAAALLLAVLVPLSFVAALRGELFARLSHLVATLMLLGAIALASGRASWLGAAVGILTASLIVQRGRVLSASAICAMAALSIGALVVDPLGLGYLENLRGRFDLWRLSVAMLSTTFPFGLGLGVLPHALGEAFAALNPGRVPTTPHNSWIQLASDAGLLGLMAFFTGFLLFVMGLRGVRRGSAARQGATAALVTYGTIGIVESLVVFTQPIGPGTYVSVASPIPWLLLAVAERERIAQERAEAGGVD